VNNQADITRDKADISSDRRDITRDRADIRSDQRDITRDRADIRSDQRNIRVDRQDLRADRGDLRNDRGSVSSAQGERRGDSQDQRFARNTGQSTTGKRVDVAKPGITATTIANNAAENNKKARATENLHKAWYHIW
jgi:hypothetical protein